MYAIVINGTVVAIDPPHEQLAQLQRDGCTMVPCDQDARIGDRFDGTRVVTAAINYAAAGAAREARRVAKLTDTEFLQQLRGKA